MQRKIIIGFSTIMLVLVFAGIFSMFKTYNMRAKYEIENLCTDALGVRVTIGELHINHERGLVRLGHVNVYNPKGFSDGAAVEIENIDVALDMSMSGQIHVSEMIVGGLQVNLEVMKTRNNLSAIAYKIKHMTPQKETSDTEKLRILIDNLGVTDNRLRPRLLVGGQKRDIVAVPDFHFTGIGYLQKGMPLKMAVVEIWNEVMPQFEKAAESAGFLGGMEAGSYSYVEEDTNVHEDEISE